MFKGWSGTQLGRAQRTVELCRFYAEVSVGDSLRAFGRQRVTDDGQVAHRASARQKKVSVVEISRRHQFDQRCAVVGVDDVAGNTTDLGDTAAQRVALGGVQHP